jgi:hypothetical protein
VTPHLYHVSLTPWLWKLKQEMIRSAKGEPKGNSPEE